MKHALSLLATLPLALSVIACSEPAPVRGGTTPSGDNGTTSSVASAPNPPSSPPKAPMNAGPLELELRLENGNRLVAVLRNNGSKPYAVVADTGIQPVALLLTGPQGEVKPFDSRMVQKFDRTVRENTFTTLAPGATEQVQFANVQGGALRWGPFQFESLPPGNYKARAILDSQIADYSDGNGGSTKKADAWIGKVTSNEVSFQIP